MVISILQGHTKIVAPTPSHIPISYSLRLNVEEKFKRPNFGAKLSKKMSKILNFS